MSEKTYIPNTDSLKSYTDLNYIHLDQHEKIWKNVIHTHPFNRALTVFLPSCSINVATEHLNQNLGCYYQVEAPLSILLEPTFFQMYIKPDSTRLTMHTVDANLNTDDVVVLDPSGKLRLSLVKNTFETFGMEALTRTKADKKHDKHIVVVDLKKPSFQPGSKEFDRLKWCLENTLTCSYTMQFCATDALTGETIEVKWPSNTTHISKKDMHAEFETLTDINIPSFTEMDQPLDQQLTANWDVKAVDALEWLGLAHLKANRIKQKKEKVDPFVSVYQSPSSFSSAHTGTLVKFKGFIPTAAIQNVLTIVRKLMASGVTNEWTSLTCWGYKDSPLTWTKMGHYQYLNSENDYTFLLLPKHKTAYIYQLYGSHHTLK